MNILGYGLVAAMQRSRFNKNKHNEIYEYAFRSHEIAIVPITTSWAKAIIFTDKETKKLYFAKMNSNFSKWNLRECEKSKYDRLISKNSTVVINELSQYKRGVSKIERLLKNNEIDEEDFQDEITNLKVEILLQRY